MSSINVNKSFKGIRFRLTLVYSTLFGLFICTFAYIITNEYINSSREDFDSALFNYAIDLSNHIQIDEPPLKSGFNLPESELRKEFPFILGQTYYFLRDIDGKIITQTSKEVPIKELPYKPDLAQKEDYTHRFYTLSLENSELRVVNLKLSNEQGKEMILQVATPANLLDDLEDRLFLTTSILVPLLILISSAVSYLIAGNALAPIKTLTDTANSIAATNLSRRVPVVKTGDEIEELSKTFNTLLARLEKAFSAQESFVANASHQLNTPLSIIKGELDVLESKPRTLEEHSRFHLSLKEEVARLIELVKNMLLISRVESGEDTFIFKLIRLDEILLATSARLGPKARDKKMFLRFNIAEDAAENLEVMGERQLLDCLFENLLDNAIKYSPKETTVSIDIGRHGPEIIVSISDEGPGILEKDIPDLLSNRFQRRSALNLPGTGLGLPLASQIAVYHKAQISYQILQPNGSCFQVRFTKQNS